MRSMMFFLWHLRIHHKVIAMMKRVGEMRGVVVVLMMMMMVVMVVVAAQTGSR